MWGFGSNMPFSCRWVSPCILGISSFLVREKWWGHRVVKGTSGLLAEEWMLRT